LEHASSNELGAVGYLLNHISAETSIAAETNREVLAGMTGVPCLGEIQFARDTNARGEILSELDLRLIDLALKGC
jgi:hypothetical protein